jgi:hypothetical protein
MTRKLGFIIGMTIALGASEVAQACTGDACSSVTAGSWSNGKVSITDKDASGKILIKVCFKNSKICNPWGISPGANSVALAQPKPPLSDASVEIVEATYSQKPTQTTQTTQTTYANLHLTNGAARAMLFSFGDNIAKKATDAPSDVTPHGSWTGKVMQRPDGTVDVQFRNVIRGDPSTPSYYRCLDLKTQLKPGGDWNHTFTESEGSKC